MRILLVLLAIVSRASAGNRIASALTDAKHAFVCANTNLKTNDVLHRIDLGDDQDPMRVSATATLPMDADSTGFKHVVCGSAPGVVVPNDRVLWPLDAMYSSQPGNGPAILVFDTPPQGDVRLIARTPLPSACGQNTDNCNAAALVASPSTDSVFVSVASTIHEYALPLSNASKPLRSVLVHSSVCPSFVAVSLASLTLFAGSLVGHMACGESGYPGVPTAGQAELVQIATDTLTVSTRLALPGSSGPITGGVQGALPVVTSGSSNLLFVEGAVRCNEMSLLCPALFVIQPNTSQSGLRLAGQRNLTWPGFFGNGLSKLHVTGADGLDGILAAGQLCAPPPNVPHPPLPDCTPGRLGVVQLGSVTHAAAVQSAYILLQTPATSNLIFALKSSFPNGTYADPEQFLKIRLETLSPLKATIVETLDLPVL